MMAVCEDGATFDLTTAEHWDENTWFDGRNQISTATDSQWDHEVLYRTAKGAWVVYAWSQWQGSRETYRRIDADEARGWLLRNDEQDAAACYFDLRADSI